MPHQNPSIISRNIAECIPLGTRILYWHFRLHGYRVIKVQNSEIWFWTQKGDIPFLCFTSRGRHNHQWTKAYYPSSEIPLSLAIETNQNIDRGCRPLFWVAHRFREAWVRYLRFWRLCLSEILFLLYEVWQESPISILSLSIIFLLCHPKVFVLQMH